MSSGDTSTGDSNRAPLKLDDCYQCEQCGGIFAEYDDCYTHIRDEHGNVAPRFNPNTGEFYTHWDTERDHQ